MYKSLLYAVLFSFFAFIYCVDGVEKLENSDVSNHNISELQSFQENNRYDCENAMALSIMALVFTLQKCDSTADHDTFNSKDIVEHLMDSICGELYNYENSNIAESYVVTTIKSINNAIRRLHASNNLPACFAPTGDKNIVNSYLLQYDQQLLHQLFLP